MTEKNRPIAFWVIVVSFGLTMVVVLLGDVMAIFNYDLAVKIGLQESVEEISEYGVQIVRALGVSDTIVYFTLMAVSLIGLFLRKRWSLLTTTAVMGISVYWSITVFFALIFLRGVPGYNLVQSFQYWLIAVTYITFGTWGLCYLIFRGDRLITDI
ncbi:MAG: hypothetical protein ACUZ77_09750 [Candidatus Brocadiales bacterium]